MRKGFMLRVMVVAAMVVGGVVGLAACGPSGGTGSGDGDEGVAVLAKVEGWRDGLQEVAGHLYMLVEVASDRSTAQRAWDDNVPEKLAQADGDPAEPGVYGTLEDVDLRHQLVVVISSGESGSCPTWVERLSTTDGGLEVELATDTGQACTDDFRPYRLVLAVDRDLLPASVELPVKRIDVPSHNLTDVEGRVVAYPVGADTSRPDTPTEADEFVREDARQRALALLGATEDDIAASEEVRIVRRGDQELPVTMDLHPGRLNLELDDDGTGTVAVTRVVVEVPDGQEPLVVE